MSLRGQFSVDAGNARVVLEDTGRQVLVDNILPYIQPTLIAAERSRIGNVRIADRETYAQKDSANHLPCLERSQSLSWHDRNLASGGQVYPESGSGIRKG